MRLCCVSFRSRQGLIAVVDRILYTWTFMIGSECNPGIAYLCLTEMEEDAVQLSEDLHDAQWITSAEFDDLINNKRMLADLQQADVY